MASSPVISAANLRNLRESSFQDILSHLTEVRHKMNPTKFWASIAASGLPVCL
ncbi:LORF7 protein [Gallid alphaherpesvirus 3]|uniref:LORF7 protein n=1 Tax=Gallid alphaherpesvirus 3 TaxID=35250 RepID=F8TC34_9ALPH|nr:LORF7 protein [Gallid alphaherpesvirus 3]AEI00245.1 LORF7 protein [Gallid alphaherpesvirus 3]QEY02334.1 LORF7 protein [Gallid alphaherpesvirus 3]